MTKKSKNESTETCIFYMFPLFLLFDPILNIWKSWSYVRSLDSAK